jgi:hypothetical protein
MFSIVTNLIISLNNIELAVFNYDAEVKPLVGTGILLHSVWYCKQSLAQWLVSKNFTHLQPLLRSDDYLFPNLLLALPAVGHPPLHFPEQSVWRHPALVPTLLAFSVISYGNFCSSLTILILCTHLALSQMRKYSFIPPRRLYILLRVAKCCFLFLFAAQTLLPYIVTLAFMVTVLPVFGIYGYNNHVVLEKAMDSLHPQLQSIAYWVSKNPNFILSLYGTCAARSLVTQLNIAVTIYVLSEDAFHAAIDPYGFHCVLRLYPGVEGSSSDALVSVATQVNGLRIDNQILHSHARHANVAS